jgi:hypothetical protein
MLQPIPTDYVHILKSVDTPFWEGFWLANDWVAMIIGYAVVGAAIGFFVFYGFYELVVLVKKIVVRFLIDKKGNK